MRARARASHQHALVIGGSVAGLLAARALSTRFARVTIVERDAMPASSAPRRGVPQGRHVHGLLAGGERILSRWFPDLIAALVNAGATRVDLADDVRWHHFGSWQQRFASGVDGYLMSRPLLELLLAERVRALPGVAVLDRCTVERLVASADRQRVTGVDVHRSVEGRIEHLETDFVVDATGYGSPMASCLQSLGYPAAAESRVAIDVAYASRIFRRPDGAADWRALFVIPRAPRRRGAFVAPIEGDRWLVTLFGLLGDRPPGDDAGWWRFAADLAVPDVHQVLRGAQALGPATVHRMPSAVRRHYERLVHFPDGLAVIGDAACTFNPIYGQGMAVAALGAQALEACLAEGGARAGDLRGVGLSFQRRLARILDAHWDLATLEDLRYPEMAALRSRGTRWRQWYTARLHEAAAHDPELRGRVLRTMNLLDPPAALAHPAVAARVAAAAWRRQVVARLPSARHTSDGLAEPGPMVQP